MMEEFLLNYGVAGAMLVYFISDKLYFQRGITKLIENNTIALTQVRDIMQSCQRKRKV